MDKLGKVLLLIVLALFALYLPLNIERANLHSFKTPIDDFIPLLTFFVTFYVSYGIFLIFTFAYFISKSKPHELNVILLSTIISCLFSYFIYVLFQNYVLRPNIDIKNVFDAIYVWGNSWLAPYNAFPSLHVAITTICTISFWRLKSKVFKLILVWAILIIASTVLTKQHYFLDVLSGLILGILSFKIANAFLKQIGYTHI